MKMSGAYTFLFSKPVIIAAVFLCLSWSIQAQQTPVQLGRAMLGAFKISSPDSLSSLRITYEEVLALSHEMGIDKDTARMASFRNSYPLTIKQFLLHYQQIMDRGMEKKSDWSKATADSITTQEEDIPVPEMPKITRMTVFFHVDNRVYRLVADIHLSNNRWKLGSNIDLLNDNPKDE